MRSSESLRKRRRDRKKKRKKGKVEENSTERFQTVTRERVGGCSPLEVRKEETKQKNMGRIGEKKIRWMSGDTRIVR